MFLLIKIAFQSISIFLLILLLTQHVLKAIYQQLQKFVFSSISKFDLKNAFLQHARGVRFFWQYQKSKGMTVPNFRQKGFANRTFPLGCRKRSSFCIFALGRYGRFWEVKVKKIKFSNFSSQKCLSPAC